MPESGRCECLKISKVATNTEKSFMEQIRDTIPSRRLYVRERESNLQYTAFTSAVYAFYWNTGGGRPFHVATDEMVASAFVLAKFCLGSKWKRVNKPKTKHDSLVNWLLDNWRICFHGKTLREWVTLYGASAQYEPMSEVEKRFPSSDGLNATMLQKMIEYVPMFMMLIWLGDSLKCAIRGYCLDI